MFATSHIDTNPFEEVTVLDLSQSVAAPYTSQLLAELGVEVIMVEPPGGGAQRRLAKGAFFPNLGRDKRSITIDLKTDGADTAVIPLIESADVFIHNYREKTITQLGYDYETVSEHNDQLIYCSVTGYGDTGPYKNRPSMDPLAQAVFGLMSVTGEQDRKPSRIGVSVIDQATGTMAVYAIMAALWMREQTDHGQKIEASLFDTAAAFMGFRYTDYSRTGKLPERSGHTFDAYAPVGAFSTANGHVYLSVPYPSVWKQFCSALDRAEWIDDPASQLTTTVRITDRSSTH